MPEANASRDESTQAAKSFIERHLNRNRREVLILRFGLDDGEPMNFKQIMQKTGRTYSSVLQLYEHGIKDLRKIMGRYDKLRKALLALGLSLMIKNAHAASAGFAWDKNTETDLAGYVLYISPVSMLLLTPKEAASDSRVEMVVISKSTPTVDVPINTDRLNFFRLTAVDTANNESGFNVDDNEQPAELAVFMNKADLNGDGVVNSTDLQLIINEILNQ